MCSAICVAALRTAAGNLANRWSQSVSEDDARTSALADFKAHGLGFLPGMELGPAGLVHAGGNMWDYVGRLPRARGVW